ncbi:MAG: MBL fold metallo-hydrolase [Ruminococcaceae bacterium]|nr:MBL fold metallo-hydrolase [Oscillospiraceae bacterium]
MAKRRKKLSPALTAFAAILSLLVGVVLGALGAVLYSVAGFESDKLPSTVVDGKLEIHFLELGNKYTGDCTYIKAGDVDILIDAGSRTTSVPAIQSYIDEYVTDGKLEYVIVTHAHQDHYAGFSVKDGSIFDLYECEVIIDFALTNQTDKDTSNMYGRYLNELEAEIAAGATHYTAAECRREGNYLFDLGDGITMEILDSYYYYNEAESENDYSVCTLFTYGDNSYLFTGDLEADGEQHLMELNDLPEVTLYKAGHHGSKTSSSASLMAVIKPEIVCVCCCCGSSEYTDTDANQFPTQQFVDNVAPYTDKVYVTTMCVDYDADRFASMNGNITVVTDKNGVRVICGSGDDRVLKEWEWFREHRTVPDAWK